jgi:hypothetical protein
MSGADPHRTIALNMLWQQAQIHAMGKVPPCKRIAQKIEELVDGRQSNNLYGF